MRVCVNKVDYNKPARMDDKPSVSHHQKHVLHEQRHAANKRNVMSVRGDCISTCINTLKITSSAKFIHMWVTGSYCTPSYLDIYCHVHLECRPCEGSAICHYLYNG